MAQPPAVFLLVSYSNHPILDTLEARPTYCMASLENCQTKQKDSTLKASHRSLIVEIYLPKRSRLPRALQKGTDSGQGAGVFLRGVHEHGDRTAGSSFAAFVKGNIWRPPLRPLATTRQTLPVWDMTWPTFKPKTRIPMIVSIIHSKGH